MARRTADPGDRLDARTVESGFEALKGTLHKVGNEWRGCGGPVDLVVGLRSAGCAFDELSRQLAVTDERLDSGRYRRVGQLFSEAASRLNIALKAGPELALDPYEVAEPFEQLGGMFHGLARSADDRSGEADERPTAELARALQPLRVVASELLFIGSVIGQATGETPLPAFVPHFEASLVRMGDNMVTTAALIVIGGALFLCRDRCAPCGVAAGPYTFTGRYQVAVVQGGLRRVDPIFSTTACCSESCLVILSRCVNKLVEKVVAAPNNVALTNQQGVAVAQAQIAGLIRTGRLAPPAFIAGDCP